MDNIVTTGLVIVSLKGNSVADTIDEILQKHESTMIETSEVFAAVIEKMHQEGNGLITASVVTPEDAAKMVVIYMTGADKSPLFPLHVQECHVFLKNVETNHPTCAANNCTNKMHKHEDVACIIITHGMTDTPTTILASGICEPCWEKFGRDRQKAMDAFMEYLSQCLPGMKSYKPEEFEAQMAGNAPSTRTVN